MSESSAASPDGSGPAVASAASPVNNNSNNNNNSLRDENDSQNGPRRFIYSQADMDCFRHSSARKELLSFVSAMGRGLTDSSSSSSSPKSEYDPLSPLVSGKLTPALASLHGSLRCVAETWMDRDAGGIPPDTTVKARFGNPAFRTWHARLVARSEGIVRCLMDCHVKCSTRENATLGDCSQKGYVAASNDATPLTPPSSPKEAEIVAELRAYLHDSFGHPVRIDYGTGHESSFVVFLLALCKIGCFRWANSNRSRDADSTNTNGTSPEAIGHASISLFHAYLRVTRGLQDDYMLEPAGSHGVWGLDDYHCVPFYLGACQLMAREQNHHLQQNQHLRDEGSKQLPDKPPSTSYLPKTAQSKTQLTHHRSVDANAEWGPSSIHDPAILQRYGDTYLYFSCIRFIKQIKKNVPFFESSPMLDDISHLANWNKVASGLIRLYEGEVLDKMPVVQHFVFGKLFKANWKPSKQQPPAAPSQTFVNGPMGDECIAPWAWGNTANIASGAANGARVGALNPGVTSPANYPGGMAPTRAPWAK